MSVTRPQPDSKVQIVVHEKPNKVWVFCEGMIHSAKWRTADNGDQLRNVVGNRGIYAAMLAWSGQDAFEMTFDELEGWSQGYGAWS